MSVSARVSSDVWSESSVERSLQRPCMCIYDGELCIYDCKHLWPQPWFVQVATWNDITGEGSRRKDGWQQRTWRCQARLSFPGEVINVFVQHFFHTISFNHFFHAVLPVWSHFIIIYISWTQLLWLASYPSVTVVLKDISIVHLCVLDINTYYIKTIMNKVHSTEYSVWHKWGYSDFFLAWKSLCNEEIERWRMMEKVGECIN